MRNLRPIAFRHSPIIGRYIVKSIIWPFLAIFLTLSLLFSGYSIAQLLSDALSSLLPISSIFILTFLKLLISMDVILPVSLFMAVVTGFGRLQAGDEIIATEALGLGPHDLLLPVIKIGLLLAILVVSLSVFLRPKAYLETHKIYDRAAAIMNINAMEANTFYVGSDGKEVTFLGGRSRPYGKASNIFIAHRIDGRVTIMSALSADPVSTNSNGHRIVHLYHVHIYKLYYFSPSNDQVIDIKQFNVNPDKDIPHTYQYSSVSANIFCLLKSSKPADVSERQWRFSTGFSTLLLAVLGASLSRTRTRQHNYSNFVSAIAAYSSYFFACSTLRNWVQHDLIQSFPGLWLAPGFLGVSIMVIYFYPLIGFTKTAAKSVFDKIILRFLTA